MTIIQNKVAILTAPGTLKGIDHDLVAMSRDMNHRSFNITKTIIDN